MADPLTDASKSQPKKRGPGRPKKGAPAPGPAPAPAALSEVDVISLLKRMEAMQKRTEEAEARAQAAEASAIQQQNMHAPDLGQPPEQENEDSGPRRNAPISTAVRAAGPDIPQATTRGQVAPSAQTEQPGPAPTAANATQPAPAKAPTVQIPKPKGQAGTDYSLQTMMGLAGSKAQKKQYLALLRHIRDLALASRIRWDIDWCDVPVAEKANLFTVVREQHPIMKRYTNDWATEAAVMQYFRNKRKHNYEVGTLDVPDKYSYLKDNSAKRSPSGSRTKKANEILAAKKRAQHQEKRQKKQRRNEGTGDDMDIDGDGAGGTSQQTGEKENWAPDSNEEEE